MSVEDAAFFRDERIASPVNPVPECFLCGRRVYPNDPKRGTYGPARPSAPELDIHLPCLDGRPQMQVARLYHKALLDMAKQATC